MALSHLGRDSGTSWRGASLLPLPRDLPTHRQFMLVSVPALCILIFLLFYTRVECASPERLPRSLGHMLSVGGQLDRYFLLTCSLSAVGGALPCDSGDELRDPFIPLSCQIAGGSPSPVFSQRSSRRFCCSVLCGRTEVRRSLGNGEDMASFVCYAVCTVGPGMITGERVVIGGNTWVL